MLGRLRTLTTLLAALALPLAANAQQATTATAPTLGVELNKLENTGDICRAYFIVQNGTGGDVAALELDTFLFDTGDIILQRLALPFGAVGEGRMRIVSFDFTLACEEIGKLFVNDILACEAGAVDCAAALATSSRATPPLDS
ncbi:MAG: Tat pathway signal protein [Pseudomonadota bacterium]